MGLDTAPVDVHGYDVCEREGCDEPLEYAGVGRRPKYHSENCRKRACDDRHRKVCPSCGGLMAVRSGWSNKEPERPSAMCRACYDAAERERVAARDAEIARMWAEGKTLREIGEHFGWPKTQVCAELYGRLPERGNVLPHRRSPKDVAAIRAGRRRYDEGRAA